MANKTNTTAPVNTVNTTANTPARKPRNSKGAKGNTAPAKGNTPEQSPVTVPAPAPKPALVNWARLTEQSRGEIVRAVRALYPSISALKKVENKTALIETGVTVTRGEISTVYRFNDRGYLSLLKAVKDTRKAEFTADIKALKKGYDFAQNLYDRFNWAMGTPQYSTYCNEIAKELGEVSPETGGDWVSKFYPYQDTEHGILVPVWVCPVSGAKTPGITGRCAKMLLYPEQYTVGTAARVFSACIDNWALLAKKAIGLTEQYTAPVTYEHGTVLTVCKFDTTTGTRGDTINTPGSDFVTAHGAGELTTVARWRAGLKLANNAK